MTQQVLLLEMNEINFDYVKFYIGEGRLPNFAALLARHGLSETTSENRYDELEPWIQWVTAHTGLTFAEHKVYRLGDITEAPVRQIWEHLEAAGLSVGAVSPMNARHNLRRPAFFVPDPWTDTRVSASWIDRRFYRAVRQAVNENANGRISAAAAADLLVGLLRNADPRNYGKYLRMLQRSRTAPWARAMFLDQILADMFVRLTRSRAPNFASLFLNAGAHIQHHYIFNSAAYAGASRNPAWYVLPGVDPVLQVYQLYDDIAGKIRRAFPSSRLMIATGLHQDACLTPVFYWRLEKHAEFLAALGVPYASVEPRMSRDFLVSCVDARQALEAERLLNLVCATDGIKLFDVDNRGTSLFVTLIYEKDVEPGLGVVLGERHLARLREHISFVALKNGMHNGVGYFCDTGAPAVRTFPLTQVYHRIRQAFQMDLPACVDQDNDLA